MLTSEGLREDKHLDQRFEESREQRKEKADQEAMKIIDRQIEMFNDINALFGYTRK